MADLGYKGKKVFVYGLGKSGFATVAALYADGAEVYAYDKRSLDELMQNNNMKKLMAKPRVFFADNADVDFSDFSAFFKSPGIDMHDDIVLKAYGAGLRIQGDVDLLFKREPKAQFIGITGTNGKSTTTALVGHVLEKSGLNVAMGGNLGTATLNLPPDKDFYVLELSSYQLETMYEERIDRAVLLNITPDHLARHGDMTGYLEAKKRIFSKKDALHVVGVDNEELVTLANEGQFTTVSVDGYDASFMVNDKGVFFEDGHPLFDMSEFSHLPGKHNWQNIACAFALIKDLMPLHVFIKSVQSYKNLPHRMEKVAEFEKVSFYNDSKATNPESAIRALESFQNIFWICGGEMKDQGLKPCLDHLNQVECAFVIGANTQSVMSELEGHVEFINCENMEKAVYEAWRRYKSSGLESATVLLSPACASWDQYQSFEHRGDVFVSLCHELVSRLQVDAS